MYKPQILSFNSGELSPLVDARSDVDKYRSGCRTLENMIPRIYGPAERRPGTKYIDTCGGISRVIPFIYSNTIAYVCLLEDQIMYFYYNGGEVLNDGGTRLSITTPYLEADLFQLQYKQSADTMWIVHPSYAPRKLTRTSATSFSLDTIVFEDGPFQKRNDLAYDNGVTLTPSSTQFVTSSDISGDASAYIASAEVNDTYDASKAFDDRTTGAGSYWQTTIGATDDEYVGCQFSSGKTIKQVNIAPFATKPSLPLLSDYAYNPKYIRIDGSNDGTTWTKVPINGWSGDCSTYHTDEAELGEITTAGQWVQLKLNNTTAYSYWRVFIHENYGGLVLRISEIEFIETTSSWGTDVTLTSSEPVFNADHVGALFSLTQQRENTNISGNMTTPTTGTTDPILVEGDFTFTTHGTWSGTVSLERSINKTVWETYREWTSDADMNVQYTGTELDDDVFYRINVSSLVANTAPGKGSITSKIKYDLSVNSSTQTGIVRVTGYTSTTIVDVEVVKTLASTDPTERWAEGCWSDHRGWPTAMTFFENRTVYAGTSHQPQTVWFSATDDFERMRSGTLDDSGFSLTMSSDTRNAIQWVSAQDALIVGTTGGEWRIRSSSYDEALTPNNFSFKQQTSRGSKAIQALVVNDAILFVDSVGRKVRECSYDGNKDKYVANDLTALAEHITLGGITSIAYQRNPDPILWCVRADGVLLSMTYEREQDVIAWSRHLFASTSGYGVTSVCVIPSSTEDEVWLVVKRSINSSDVYYLEQMQPRTVTDQEDMWFVDSGLDWDSTATDSFSGLDHLEGEIVATLGDGAVINRETVSSGTVTLDESVSRAIIGLPFTYTLKPMRFDLQVSGTTKGTLKRFAEVALSFHRSGNVKYGRDSDNLFLIDWRTTEAYTEPPDLYTGDKVVTHEGGFSVEDDFIITGNDPLPCTVRAIIPRVDISGR